MPLPLNAIQSFEVAAHQLSFAGAVKDLNVHSPVVSCQLAELERILGVLLFVHSKPRLALTTWGQGSFAAISAGLNQIRQARERIGRQPEHGLLKVKTSIGFAGCSPDCLNFISAAPTYEYQTRLLLLPAVTGDRETGSASLYGLGLSAGKLTTCYTMVMTSSDRKVAT